MKKTQKRFLTSSIGSEGLPFFGTALTAALGYAVPVGLLSAKKALSGMDPALLPPYIRPGAALCILFALCGALQSLFAEQKSVQMQQKSIGLRKALGFTSGEMMKHHLLVSQFCALSAVLLGLLMSVCVVQLPLLALIAPEAALSFSPAAAAWGAALIFALFGAAAYGTCAKLLRCGANDLMMERALAARRPLLTDTSLYARMNMQRRMTVKSALIPDTLIPTLACTAFSAAALSLSLLTPLPGAWVAAALSLLMLTLNAVCQISAHVRQQAEAVSIARACGCTAREARAMALGGILALTAAGIVLGAVLGVVLAALL